MIVALITASGFSVKSGSGCYIHLTSKNRIDPGCFCFTVKIDHTVHNTVVCDGRTVHALSACLAGEVQKYLVRGMYEEAVRAARRYEGIFGRGNFFLELQDHGIPEQKAVNTQLLRMSKETGIDLVATNDVHYTYASDADSHDILLCLQTGKKLSDTDRMRYEGGQYFVKSEEEMKNLFPYALEALENTQKIADRCHVEIEFGVTKLPKYDVPDGYTSWEYLQKLCHDGLVRCYGEETKGLKERLDYELGIIQKMGYVDYFLIV